MHSTMYAIYCPCMTPFGSAWKRWGARPGWPKNAGNSPTRRCISVIRKNSFAAYGAATRSPLRGWPSSGELAIWRDREARQRDRPPGSVLHDELLVEIARKAPRTLNDLQRLRGFPTREIERSGSTLLGLGPGAGRAGKRPSAAPAWPWPYAGGRAHRESPRSLPQSPLRPGKLSSAFIASRTDLETLVRRYRQGRLATEGSPILEGWRGALVGQELLAVLSGRVSIQLHPQTGRVEFIPRTLTRPHTLLQRPKAGRQGASPCGCQEQGSGFIWPCQPPSVTLRPPRSRAMSP